MFQILRVTLLHVVFMFDAYIILFCCVPLIKIHYLISVICSSFASFDVFFLIIFWISYNKTKTGHVYKRKDRARGKPCVCFLTKWSMRVFELENAR